MEVYSLVVPHEFQLNVEDYKNSVGLSRCLAVYLCVRDKGPIGGFGYTEHTHHQYLDPHPIRRLASPANQGLVNLLRFGLYFGRYLPIVR